MSKKTSLNNPRSRPLTPTEEAATVYDGPHDLFGRHVQATRPDDYDGSRDFDRARGMDMRPPLDEDPFLIK
jgi:hypothetical protein